MSKKITTQESPEVAPAADKIDERPLTEAMDEFYTNYAWHTIEERALPDLRDGLKPAQRRTLFALKQMGLKSGGGTAKCARVTGQVCGTLHPHGDGVVYPTLYRMAQDWVLRYPLVIGQGNFGSIQGHSVAAQRYCVTGETLVSTPDRGLVPVRDFSPNGDEVCGGFVHSEDGTMNQVSRWFDCGLHPTLRVHTNHGYTVRGTENHPVLVLRLDEDNTPKREWVCLSDVKAGDWLVMDRGRGNSIHENPLLPHPNTGSKFLALPTKMTVDLALLLGTLTRHGHMCGDRISFGDDLDHGNSFRYKETFESRFASVFPGAKLNTIQYQDRAPFGKRAEIYTTRIIDFLAGIGFHTGNMSPREIPWSILRSSPDCQAAYLSALFESDGVLTRFEDGVASVYFTASGEHFWDQAQVLLLSLGVASVRYSESDDDYLIKIEGLRNLEEFETRVGFTDDENRNNLRYFIESFKERDCYSRDIVPFFDYCAQLQRTESSSSYRAWLRTAEGFSGIDDLQPARGGFRKLEEVLSGVKDEARGVLSGLVCENVFYSQVSDVFDAGEERVYSVRVDSACHSFVANGFVNHNTECKLSKYGEALLDNLNEKVVPFAPNYDEREVEPTILPAAFPNLLANGSSGIAVALATRCPPHNLTELGNLIAAYIKNDGALTTDEIIGIMPGPDFPTGGVLRGRKGIRAYYETGRGTLVMEGVFSIEQDAKGNASVVISQVPYETSPKDIEHEIIELVQGEKIKGIKDVKDLSYGSKGSTVINLVVYLDKTANAQIVANQILKHTSLRKTYSVNVTVTHSKKVAQNVPMLKLIGDFVEHRRIVFRNRFAHEMDTHEKRGHVLDGYVTALAQLDDAIRIIRGAKGRDEARAELIKREIVATEAQADAVLELKLAALTKLEGDKIRQELDKLSERRAWLSGKLGDDKAILALVAEEQTEIARTLGDARRTRIEGDAEDITAEDLTPSEEVVISLTKDGYVKRLKLDTYRVQRRGGKGVAATHKTQDDAGDVYVANSHDLLLFFTSSGMLHQRKAYEVPEATGRTSKGIHLANLLSLGAGETIEATIPVKTLDADGYVLIVTRGGVIKRTLMREYGASLRRSGLKAISLNEGDTVRDVAITDGSQDVFLVTRHGLAVRYGESRVRSTGRVTAGVKALDMRADKSGNPDGIARMITFSPLDDPDVLIITEYAFGKRTKTSAFRETKSRTVKGVAAISDVRFDRNGYVVGATVVAEDDTVIILTTQGKLIQMPASGIRKTGRIAIGAKLVDMVPGDSVSGVARVVGGSLRETEAE